MSLSAGEFLRHRTLILVAAGGAVAEAGLLALLAPAALPVAPQVSALPVLAAYHDLRWLFTDGQSWVGFAGLMLAVLLVRAAVDALLLRLAWPSDVPAPRPGRAFRSCLVLTAVAWLLLSPAATLDFGVAELPFSWPFLAALPIMIGIMLALSHGGVLLSWWRRLPPVRSVLWLLASFVALSASAVAIVHVDTAAALVVAAVTGLVNARAWYGMAVIASRLHPRPHPSVPGRVLLGLPFAPLAALAVFALVVGVARLMFTGTIQISPRTPPTAAAGIGGAAGRAAGTGSTGDAAATSTAAQAGAVLVVGGWGSSCCAAADALRREVPKGVVVRQFSYRGLDAKGQPLPSGASADDIPIPSLGDRVASQLLALHRLTRGPVSIVAESEGTLGVYAMLTRHPGLPVGSVVLLSPIIQPGQLRGAGASVPGYALEALNHLVGRMSPYGPGGAEQLLSSVSEFGAQYFAAAAGNGGSLRWLVVVPLADALTLPDCQVLPPGVLFVPGFHGGLLGDPRVLPAVTSFLAGHPVDEPPPEASRLRAAAELITAAATAWRMPSVTTIACS